MIANRSVPTASVIPVLAYVDVPEAAEWLCRAFGFRERLRIEHHRAQLVFGDGAVIVVQLAATGDEAAGTPVARSGVVTHAVHVRVADAREHHDAAVRARARILQPPADHPYGERQYAAEDPGGHRWTFSESIADVDPPDWGGTLVDDFE